MAERTEIEDFTPSSDEVPSSHMSSRQTADELDELVDQINERFDKISELFGNVKIRLEAIEYTVEELQDWLTMVENNMTEPTDKSSTDVMVAYCEE